VAALIGAEAGAAFGVLKLGATPLAPLGLAAAGAAIGPLAALGARRARTALVRRWLRSQMRAAR
jgi:hypothetical protein